MKPSDFIGARFGRLAVIAVAADSTVRRPAVMCRCACGIEKRIATDNLRSGATTSCGCRRREVTATRSLVHGHRVNYSRTKAYICWRNMRKRCLNPNDPKWPDYGGRGITINPQWDEFAAFFADMGDPPRGKTLDRINNDGNYEPGNCHWATPRQQANNRRPRRSKGEQHA